MFDIGKWFRERGAKLPAKDTQIVDKTLGLKPGTSATVNDAAVDAVETLAEQQIIGVAASVVSKF